MKPVLIAFVALLALSGCGTAGQPTVATPRATVAIESLGEKSVKEHVRTLAGRTLLAVTVAEKGLPDISLADDVAIRAAVNFGFKQIWGKLKGDDAETDEVRAVMDDHGFKRYQIAFTKKQTEKTIACLKDLKELK